jgi:hypothetical protein
MGTVGMGTAMVMTMDIHMTMIMDTRRMTIPITKIMSRAMYAMSTVMVPP